MSTKKTLNGKKRYIVSGGVSLTFLVGILFQFKGDISSHAVQISAQAEAIKKIEQTPIDIAKLNKDMDYIKEQFSEFKTEQKTISSQLDKMIDLLNHE